MRDDIRKELLERLATDYKFEDKGTWLQKGKCPDCGRKELFARNDAPWVLRCGRSNRCGWEQHVKDLYPDIFDNWSNRYQATEKEPNAAADAYLKTARGFDLGGLAGCYSQESYVDRDRNIATATVRFPLPGGSWWERLIDQPGRFDKKARFAYGQSYAGQWWTAPDHSAEVLARASRIWICEGIFDALSLRAAGEVSASAMSCNNYPELALAELRKEIARLEIGGGPELIFAFDVGKAGREYSAKFVEKARAEGWKASAATVKPEGEGEKLDWNDLHLLGRLTAPDLEEYLWHGQVMIAPSATEKACLIFDRKGLTNFSLVHDSRTWWAQFNKARIAEVVVQEKVTEKAAARACADVNEIASCAFRILYFQTDAATDESHYYLRVDTPSSRKPAKAPFSTSAMAAAAEFNKRLLGVAPGAQWWGSGMQLVRITEMQKGKRGIRQVETLDFTGYSKDHGAWVFGEIAVAGGRVQHINEEDYFDLGKVSLKLRTRERILALDYDPDQLPHEWLPVVWKAFGTNGLITVVFWVMSFFAEQIRDGMGSFPFLEMVGDAGSGKTTLTEALWKLCGRRDYEGFDPQKATSAAIARILGKVANLPVILLEGDRDDDKPFHGKRFDWEELKTAYNGRSVRSRGVRNGGNETYEPPFRGAIIIEQNEPVNASRAILERIVHLQFDKTMFSEATKAQADRLKQWPIEELSGFIAHMARQEARYLKTFHEAFRQHEAELKRRGKVNDFRLILNHAQLAAALDALAAIVPVDNEALLRTRERLYDMAAERLVAISGDHQTVSRFWELFDHLELHEDSSNTDTCINRHRKPLEYVAVSLPHFEERCRARNLSLPSEIELKRHLKSSKSRPFVKADTVNTVNGKSVHCWVFAQPKQRKEKADAA